MTRDISSTARPTPRLSVGRASYHGQHRRANLGRSVGHLWIVDPLMRTLEVYRLEGGRWAVASAHGGQEVVRAEPFDAIEIDIGRWWLEQARLTP